MFHFNLFLNSKLPRILHFSDLLKLNWSPQSFLQLLYTDYLCKILRLLSFLKKKRKTQNPNFFLAEFYYFHLAIRLLNTILSDSIHKKLEENQKNNNKKIKNLKFTI